MSRRRVRDLTDEEAALFRRAVADAAPLPGREKPGTPAPAPVPRRPRQPPPTAAMPDLAPPAARLQSARPLDRATHARLKKGRLEIEGRLDLHGMTATAARRNLAAFLRSSQAQGRRAVLVITGRGLDPEGLGRGVLKRETPHWLDAMPDTVAGYGEADRRHGGSGALYVRIRRKDKARRS